MNSRVASAVACALLGATGAAAQQPAPPPPAFAAPNLAEKGVRSMAANCAACHGTTGKPVANSAVASLAGRPGTSWCRSWARSRRASARPRSCTRSRRVMATTRSPPSPISSPGSRGKGGEMRMDRRQFLKAGAAGAAVAVAGCATMPGARARARVAVVGGGYGGATAARYIRLLDPSIEVVLIEPNEAFVSCPISNMVLGGFRTMADITTPYAALERTHGVKLVRDMATAIDVERREVRLARGEPVKFDRVIVSPGIDFMYEALPAMGGADAQGRVLHAWKAGPQTAALRRQLEAMRDGGVYVL